MLVTSLIIQYLSAMSSVYFRFFTHLLLYIFWSVFFAASQLSFEVSLGCLGSLPKNLAVFFLFVVFFMRINAKKHIANTNSTIKTAFIILIFIYPTDPSICNSINLFISILYSIGRIFVNGSIKPLTIRADASSSLIPLVIK